MLSLMNKAFEPSLSYSDKITYMTNLYHTQSIRSDNGLAITAEKIQDLLSSTTSRLLGLQLLEVALQQNPDIYLKGRWTVVLIDVLKGGGSTVLKIQACRLFCVIIPYIGKDPTYNKANQNELGERLLLLLINGIKNDCEWFEAACELLVTCTKYFPQAIGRSNQIKDAINAIIYKQIAEGVSNKILQLIAEIYSELPNCVPNIDPGVYEESWLSLYYKLLASMQKLLHRYLYFMDNDPFTENDDKEISESEDMFENEEPVTDMYLEFTKLGRRYVNLSTCLVKMLSHKTKFPVKVPVRSTIRGLTRSFQCQEIFKTRPPSYEVNVFYSSLSRMQISDLLVLEALVLNFNLGSYPLVIVQILYAALHSSRSPSVSTETVYQLRLAVYMFLNKYIPRLGNNGCADLFRAHILEDLLSDICLDDGKSSQASAKSKKSVFTNCLKNNPVQRKVCKAALKALENMLYCGSNLMSKQMFQELFTKVTGVICNLLTCVDSYPFPYDDDSCRKSLYSLLLALAVNSKPNLKEPIQYSPRLFKMALRDTSIKVTRQCHKAMATLRLCLHPKRPPVELINTVRKPSAVLRFPQWCAEPYAPNLPAKVAANVPLENTVCRTAQTFHNNGEGGMDEEEEPMDDDVEESHYSERAYSEYSEPYMGKYPEQMSAGERNGEDVLEVMNSSECQEDSEEEDEEEEEEEEEDRSYGEEDINEEDVQPAETDCVPGTSKLQGVIPVHINQEPDAITLEEYEPIKQCAKAEGGVGVECKSKQLNGVRNSVPEGGDVPSTSRQCLSNENGIENSEEEELEDDEEEEEEEEEGIQSFPAEKRAPEFYASPPAAKKPKLENEEEIKEKPAEEHRSASPPLQVMKDSFCVDFKEETKS